MGETPREAFSKTLSAALVGALVALLISPFSQSISLIISENFARPILSIEYVEFVPEEAPMLDPIDEREAIINSDGYRLISLRNMAGASAFMPPNVNKITSSEKEALQKRVVGFIATIDNRLDTLSSIEKKLAGNITDAQAAEIATTLQGSTGMFLPMSGLDAVTVEKAASGKIIAERNSLIATRELTHKYLNTLERLEATSTGNVKLKVSILNRGSTDGLIRNIGSLRFPNVKKNYRLKRTKEPEGHQMFNMAVPVTVMNQHPDINRVTAVGKVLKHSMVEFWFQVDKEAVSEADLRTLWKMVSEKRLAKSVISLDDHENNEVVFRVPLFYYLDPTASGDT